jgi:hypothetical protein
LGAKRINGDSSSPVEPALEVDGTGTGRDIADTLSATMACARSVDVVVPSPTASPVRSAAPRSICAPRFSSGSFRANSLAIVTPSLQTTGLPHFFSMSTHRDLGPRVTRTASAIAVAPRSTFSRASDLNKRCLCGMTDLTYQGHDRVRIRWRRHGRWRGTLRPRRSHG